MILIVVVAMVVVPAILATLISGALLLVGAWSTGVAITFVAGSSLLLLGCLGVIVLTPGDFDEVDGQTQPIRLDHRSRKTPR